MSREPVVRRVIEALERAVSAADNAYDAAGAADYTGADSDAAYADAKNAAIAAGDDLEAARECSTLAGLLACDRPAVGLAAQFALEPTDPVAERVIKALELALDAACTADDVAAADDRARLVAGIELVHDDVREVFVVAVENTQTDLYAALKCKTLADLLASDRPAVRIAAQLALKPTPPAPKRKR